MIWLTSAYLCIWRGIVTGGTADDDITAVKPVDVGSTVSDGGSAEDSVVLKIATGLGVGLDVGRDTER